MNGRIEKYIDLYQGRVFSIAFIVVVVLSALSILLAIVIGGNSAPNIDAFTSVAVNIIIAACGVASSIIVFWLLLAHDKNWWGNAYGAIAFIGMGAGLSGLLSALNIVKEIVAMFK